jgi:type I restriction enzyme, R subunit
VSSLFGEDALAERPALEWLRKAGWQHVHGRQLAAGRRGSERKAGSDVVLIDRLRTAVARINPQLPADVVQRVCERVLEGTSNIQIENHRGFHELLVSGVPFSYVDEEEVEQSGPAWLVDFENPSSNDLLAVNQLTVLEGGHSRRLDILLFVNGLPLGQLELKAPGRVGSAAAAVNQVHHYTETIPSLYRYVEVVGVSDLMTARVGTSSTPDEHFAEWRTMAGAGEVGGRTQLQIMLEGVFAPARFLELIRDFVLFVGAGARTWKVLAKYNQVHAVHAALDAAAAAMHGDRRGGIVWHAPGTGKSYTMVFLVNKLRRDARFANPTVVLVTDRTDLEDQLLGDFTATHLAPACKQAEEIAGGQLSLHELLKVPAGGIVFTTIQKFVPADGQPMPVLSERKNIFVMADEAHRSQYAGYARNITKALPAATRIGFTGTPVETADRSTRLVFGDYVSVYRMRQAQADRATVPIYYESRPIQIEIGDRERLAEVEEILEEEEPAAAAKLTCDWTRLERVLGARGRLQQLAEDIHSHFTARCEAQSGKAMVIAYSRRIAVELTHLLRARFGEEAVDCVIWATATDEREISRFRRSKGALLARAGDFRDPDHPLRIVVVKNMWLTGFDAPALHTLYLDRPMRDHGLLQAIARVNRVFADKQGGLVIDYVGLGEDLRTSLRAYDQTELEDPTVSIAEALAGLWEKYEALCALLYPAGYRRGELALATVSELLAACVGHVLASEQRTSELLDGYTVLAKLLALVGPHEAVGELRGELDFLKRIAIEVRKAATSIPRVSPEAERAIRRFMSDGLAAGKVVDAIAAANDDRPDISVLSEELIDSLAAGTEHPNIRLRLLEKLLKGEISSRARTNQAQAKLFGDRLEAVLRRYESRQLSAAEVTRRFVEIAKGMRGAARRHEQLDLSREEAAIFEVLAECAERVGVDPRLAAIAKELAEGIRAELTIDWAERKASEAKLRRTIRRILRACKYQVALGAARGDGDRSLHSLDRCVQLVLEQAKVLYGNMPDFEDRSFSA